MERELNKEESISFFKKTIERIELNDEKIIVKESTYQFEDGSSYPTIVTVKINL